MNLISLITAFAGGIFGALIGGTTAFIFAGLIALVGIAISLSGGGTVMLDQVAFGSLFGPHVAFVGGVAASAYVGKKKKEMLEKHNVSYVITTDPLNNEEIKQSGIDREKLSRFLVEGPDTTIPLFQTKDPIVLLIAGIFGVLGYALNYLFADVLALPMDTIAFTVLTMGIASRFIFGSTGLLGDFPEDESRFGIVADNLIFNIITGMAVSAIIGYVVLQLQVDNIGFAISAFSLIFLYFGVDFPVTHHVTMVTGFAAMTFGNIWMAILFGTLAMILGEIVQRLVNTHVDTHIDMPAIVIASLSLIILGVFG